VLVWLNNAEGNLRVDIDPRCQRAPGTVEHAARDWWSQQSGI
jgi:hypothetical protein